MFSFFALSFVFYAVNVCSRLVVGAWLKVYFGSYVEGGFGFWPIAFGRACLGSSLFGVKKGLVLWAWFFLRDPFRGCNYVWFRLIVLVACEVLVFVGCGVLWRICYFIMARIPRFLNLGGPESLGPLWMLFLSVLCGGRSSWARQARR